jgi:hypothetical protein
MNSVRAGMFFSWPCANQNVFLGVSDFSSQESGTIISEFRGGRPIRGLRPFTENEWSIMA